MRKRECVTKRDWDIMLDALDGDTQDALTECLEQFEPGPNVTYTVDGAGRVDSESWPSYTASDVDECLTCGGVRGNCECVGN